LLHSAGKICALLGYYAVYTDVSGQPAGPIFKSKEFQEERLSRKVGEKLPLLAAQVPLLAAQLPLLAAQLPLLAAQLPLLAAQLPLLAAQLPRRTHFS